VDRDRLFDVNGRSRHRQYELVRDYGLKEFACPAGGCLLTDPMFSRKLKDFFEHEPENDLRDVGFLRVGRHFRFEKRRFIFGRNREENEYLERARTLSYSLFRPVGFKGPSGLVKGKMNDDDRKFVAAIFASYGKRSEPRIAFEVLDEERKEYAVEWASVEIDQYRIKESS
jgi:tRNA-specific 2-thiouridylase